MFLNVLLSRRASVWPIYLSTLKMRLEDHHGGTCVEFRDLIEQSSLGSVL